MKNATQGNSHNHSDVRAALVLAHPGHELCLYGWIKQTKPRVFIFTDGSGHSGNPRIESTKQILNRLHVDTGSLFGQFTDKCFYEALLSQRLDFFVNLSEQLAAELIEQEISFVVGDALEGYNPTHDVCRLVTDAAVAIARGVTGQNIENYEYPVVGRPDANSVNGGSHSLRIALDPETFREKLAAARDYLELQADVDTFVASHSEDAFRIEHLYPAKDRENGHPGAYFYEKHGEQRVREGYYKEVIRYQSHVLPLAMRLKERASQ